MVKEAIKNANSNQKMLVGIGRLFREARERANLTQHQAAEELGYTSAQFISNFERGKCLLPLFKMRVLANMYKMNTRVLAETLIQHNREKVYRTLGVKPGRAKQ